MPRDLFNRQAADPGGLLTASPDAETPRFGTFAEQMRCSRTEEKENLHPYIQTLTIADVESCVALENAAFPEAERCSREKFVYRLTTCPEFALGLFSTSDSDGLAASSPTFPRARPPDSTHPAKKGVLIGHVIATQSAASLVTDESMEIPQDWQPSLASSGKGGQQEGGRTVVVHSVAILPQFQRQGLGRTILKAYVQRMESSGICDRIALLAHEEMIRFYENSGFRNQGKSEVKFGGGGWSDMIYEFSDP